MKQNSEIMQKQGKTGKCPAKCKRTGKCYGIAYFDAKPGKVRECVDCKWGQEVTNSNQWKD